MLCSSVKAPLMWWWPLLAHWCPTKDCWGCKYCKIPAYKKKKTQQKLWLTCGTKDKLNSGLPACGLHGPAPKSPCKEAALAALVGTVMSSQLTSPPQHWTAQPDVSLPTDYFFPTFFPPLILPAAFHPESRRWMYQQCGRRLTHVQITSALRPENSTPTPPIIRFLAVYVFHTFRIIYHCKMTVGHMGNERCSSRAWRCERSVVALLYSALYCRTPH